MEREACRQAMLPIVACNGVPNYALCLFQSWKLPRGLARILSVSRRREPIGDVWGVRVDRADSVARVFGPLPAIVPAPRCRPAEGSTAQQTGPSSSKYGVNALRSYLQDIVARVLASCKATRLPASRRRQCSLHLLLGNVHRLRDQFSAPRHRFWVQASIG